MNNDRKQRLLEKLATIPSIIKLTLKKNAPSLLKRLRSGQQLSSKELAEAGLSQSQVARAMEHSYGRRAAAGSADVIEGNIISGKALKELRTGGVQPPVPSSPKLRAKSDKHFVRSQKRTAVDERIAARKAEEMSQLRAGVTAKKGPIDTRSAGLRRQDDLRKETAKLEAGPTSGYRDVTPKLRSPPPREKFTSYQKQQGKDANPTEPLYVKRTRQLGLYSPLSMKATRKYRGRDPALEHPSIGAHYRNLRGRHPRHGIKT